MTAYLSEFFVFIKEYTVERIQFELQPNPLFFCANPQSLLNQTQEEQDIPLSTVLLPASPGPVVHRLEPINSSAGIINW